MILGGPFVDVNNEDIFNGEILIEKSNELKCLEFKDLYLNIFKFLEKELGDLNV
mgnify:CR=1 FL=1